MLHDSAEVRAAGIRSIRHFIRTENQVKCVYKLKLDFLITRSIDICLDNKTERIQALRLIRKLLSIDYQSFPLSFARCLIAIARDGNDKNSKDLILRTCLAILSELIILNPELSYKCDLFSSLMDSICRCSNPYNILESVLGSYIYLINNPELRIYTDNGADLQKFIGIFIDLPYVSWSSNSETAMKAAMNNSNQLCASEEIESRLQFIKNILVSLFRSWPGLIYMCQTTKNDILIRRNPATLQLHSAQEQYHNFQVKNVQNLNGVQTLVEMMYLPVEEETRKHLMEIIFELFYLPIPEWTDDFETALFSTNLLVMQDNWQLYNNFVAGEAKNLLPHTSKSRLNFTDNYMSLLLYSLISNGLLESLISIIITQGNLFNSVRATILLGELLHLTNQYLPPEMSQVCHSLPQLMNACISSKLTIKQKTIANTAVSCLDKMHSLKKKPMTPASLFLDLILQFSNPSFRSSFYDLQLSKWRAKDIYYKIKENEENSILNAIRQSNVILKDYNQWDWSLIGFLLKVSSDYMKRIEDNPHKPFIRKLILFFKPTSKQFSSIDHNDPKAKEISLIGLYLFDFLIDCDAKSTEFINELMTDLNLCLSQISIDNAPSTNCILGPGKMLSTLSSSYFLYIGKLTSIEKGRKLLEKSGIYQCLVNLISTTTNDVYIKLIVSSLDYSRENFSRKLLIQALTCKLDSARLYATNFLRVLLRTEMPDFHKWVIELLVQQLSDENLSVSLSAVDILDEACDKLENLLELMSLRPNILHLYDKGILLFSRFASCKEGFNYLNNINLLNYELDRWRKTFCLKYVNIIEEILNETFTYHQKSEDDGSYGRRMDKKHFMVKKNAYLPPHLYGQLANCKEGCELLINESIIPDHISKMKKIISFDIRSSTDKKLHCSELIDYKELTVKQLKASLWALAHISSTEFGLELIKETDFLQIVVELASNCQLLSIRATCFYCLGLISTTEWGSSLLIEYNWISLRHNRLEKWPIYKEMIEKNEIFSYPFKQLHSREYTPSISSSIGTGSRLVDVNNLTVNNVNTSSGSGVLIDPSNVDNHQNSSGTDQPLSKSLSHIENDKLSFLKSEQLNENYLNKNPISFNKLSSLHSNQIRPRSSSDCNQKVSFQTNNRKSSTNDYSNLLNSTQLSQTSFDEIQNQKQTNSTDPLDNQHHHLNLSNHLDNNHSSPDQLTSSISLGDVELEHHNQTFPAKLNSSYDSKTMYLPSVIDENSTFDPLKSSTNYYRSNQKPLQYSLSTRKHPQHFLNSLHPGPKRKTSEPTGSMDFKTFHLRMIKHSSTTNICQLKQTPKVIDNVNNINDNNNNDELSKPHPTSYPDSNRLSSSSFENSLPLTTTISTATQHHNREAYRKLSTLSQISNPHSLDRNYSLFINSCLTADQNLDGRNCEHLLGLQDDSFDIAMPSTADTIGYAALKRLQHKKKKTNQLLMFNDQFTYLKEGLLHNKEEKNNNKFLELNDEFTKEFTNGFKLSSIGTRTDFRIKSEFYMSICLPDNLSLIFDLEVRISKQKCFHSNFYNFFLL